MQARVRYRLRTTVTPLRTMCVLFLACFSSASHLSQLENRIGDVPTSWYKEYDHIGYNVKGMLLWLKQNSLIQNQARSS